MHDQLLGYALGSLEPSEQEALQVRLANDPELRQQLALIRRSLEPLDDARPIECPSGLAARTCRHVADRRGPAPGQFAAVGTWRLPDLTVATCLFVLAAMALVPAFNQSRQRSQVLGCQRNLMSLGRALFEYSAIHDDHFPEVPAAGPLSVAGVYAPQLREAGLIQASDVRCPAAQSARRSTLTEIPSRAEIERLAGVELRRVQSLVGGDYGYGLGYVRRGRYTARRNQSRAHFAIMSDAPPEMGETTAGHHGSWGHNVLFEDGHVRLVTRCRLGDDADHFFQNDLGVVAAGLGPDDAVIVRSGVGVIILNRSSSDE